MKAGFQAETTSATGIPDTRQMRIRGRVTLDETPQLRRAVLGEISRGAAKRLILELGGVETMDTSGAAVLAEAIKAGENNGMHVLLCGPSESVVRIFRLAGFEEVLDRCCSGWDETRQRLVE